MAKRPRRGTGASVAKAPAKARGAVRKPRVGYSFEKVAEITELIAQGGKWAQIAKLPGMPSVSSFYLWQDTHPEFAALLRAGREMGADFKADEALRVAEEATKDTVQQDRLKVTTLLKHAAAMSPRRWGRKAGEPEPEPKAPKLVTIRLREFVPVIRADGTVFTREIMPDGSLHDFED